MYFILHQEFFGKGFLMKVYFRLSVFLKLALLCLLPLSGGAQTLKGSLEHNGHIISFNYWTISDGLPNWMVRAMSQDERGYIWMLGQNSLYRFDGQSFKEYKPDIPPGTQIFSMSAFKMADEVWLSVGQFPEDREIVIFNPLTGLFSYPKVDTLDVSFKGIRTLFQSEKGFVFQNGKNEVWNYNGTWKRLKVLDCDSCIYVPAQKSQYWIVNSHHGIMQLFDARGIVRTTIDHSRMDDKSFVRVRRFFLDNKSRVWLNKKIKTSDPSEQGLTLLKEDGTYDASAYYAVPAADFSNITFSLTRHSGIQKSGYQLLIDKPFQLNILYKGKDIGINLIEYFKKNYDLQIEPEHVIFFPEQDGSAWIRYAGGLMNIRVKPLLLQQYPALKGISVRGIHVSKDYAIVGTETGVFGFPDGIAAAPHFQLDFSGIPGPHVGMGILPDKDSIWISLRQGEVYKLSAAALKAGLAKVPAAITTPPHRTGGLFRGKNGEWLLQSIKGILQMDEEAQAFVPYMLMGNNVLCTAFWRDTLWAGTDMGVINTATRMRYQIKGPNGDLLKVSHIYPDKEGTFWLSTQQGMYRWSPGGKKATAYTYQYGLPDVTVYAAIPDLQGRLWIPSDIGLYCLDLKKKVSFSFGINDGMPHHECNYMANYTDEDGRIYIGTIKGLFSFHPGSIPTPVDETHAVYVDDIIATRAFDKTLSLYSVYKEMGVISIRPGDKQVQIRFTSPTDNRSLKGFQWRIPSLSTQWKNTTDYEINFVKLPYGHYDLEIRPLGTGVFRFDDLSITTIPLHVRKPFYQTGLFYILLVVLIALIIRFFYHQRWKSAQKRNQELKQQVSEKTRELYDQNEMILRQKEEIERLYELKNKHLAHLNHEFRTPLTIIKGYIREIKDSITRGNGDVSKALGIMERNTDQLFDLTEDVLELARLDAGAVTLQEKVFEWRRFLQLLVANFEGLALKKDIVYALEWGNIPESVTLLMDQKKVARILNNLLMNALKFTPQGGQITIHSHCTDDEVFIKVQDTGMGISDKDLPYIFNRYYQAPNTIDSTRPGFGIGLPLCREYAELMGGSMTVESKEGVGSAFFLTLPLKWAEMEEEQTNEAFPKPGEAPMPFIQPESSEEVLHPRLLIAEDSPDMQQYLYDVLSPQFHVTLANDGAIAWKMLSENSSAYDLVISDIMMPNMDGTELLNKVRMSETLSDMPFIFLTALAEQEEIIEALYIGVDSYLTKPFVVEELLARINSLLHYRKQRNVYRQTNEEKEDNRDAEPLSKAKWLKELDDVLENSIQYSDLKVDALAQALFVSERTLRSRIHHFCGMSPSEYVLKYRLQKALKLLETQTHTSISQVCYTVGFKNTSHFSRVFKAEFGKSPSDYIR